MYREEYQQIILVQELTLLVLRIFVSYGFDQLETEFF